MLNDVRKGLVLGVIAGGAIAVFITCVWGVIAGVVVTGIYIGAQGWG